MPYRIDLPDPAPHAFEQLIELGALDVELLPGVLAAIMPDSVAPDMVQNALGGDIRVTPAAGRDDGSVWTIGQRPFKVGRLEIVPAATAGSRPDRVVLADTPAFGSGLHPTTALCLESIERLIDAGVSPHVLDVGTGTGILALAALRLGMDRAVGLDIDPAALRAAGENARLNGLTRRLSLVLGRADAVRGTWPLVIANIRAAELIEMAPSLVCRIGSQGWLVLSGIPQAVAPEVAHAYTRLGMISIDVVERAGWSLQMYRPTW